MVTHIHRIIHTIGEKVITTNISSNTGDRIIRINPPTNLRIVITAGYIIEPGLGVVVIAAAATFLMMHYIARNKSISNFEAVSYTFTFAGVTFSFNDGNSKISRSNTIAA